MPQVSKPKKSKVSMSNMDSFPIKRRELRPLAPRSAERFIVSVQPSQTPASESNGNSYVRIAPKVFPGVLPVLVDTNTCALAHPPSMNASFAVPPSNIATFAVPPLQNASVTHPPSKNGALERTDNTTKITIEDLKSLQAPKIPKNVTPLLPKPTAPGIETFFTMADLEALMLSSNPDAPANIVDPTADFLSKINRASNRSVAASGGRPIRREKAQKPQKPKLVEVKSQTGDSMTFDPLQKQKSPVSTQPPSPASAAGGTPVDLDKVDLNSVEFITDAHPMQRPTLKPDADPRLEQSLTLMSDADPKLSQIPALKYNADPKLEQSLTLTSDADPKLRGIPALKSGADPKLGQSLSLKSEERRCHRQVLEELWDEEEDKPTEDVHQDCQIEDGDERKRKRSEESKENCSKKGKWRFDSDLDTSKPYRPLVTMPVNTYRSVIHHKIVKDIPEPEQDAMKLKPVKAPVKPLKPKSKPTSPEQMAVDPTPSLTMTTKKTYYCSKCANYYATLKLIMEHECCPRYKCEDCEPNRSFPSQTNLTAHLNDFHFIDKQKCKFCRYSASYKTQLMRHLREKHNYEDRIDPDNETLPRQQAKGSCTRPVEDQLQNDSCIASGSSKVVQDSSSGESGSSRVVQNKDSWITRNTHLTF